MVPPPQSALRRRDPRVSVHALSAGWAGAFNLPVVLRTGRSVLGLGPVLIEMPHGRYTGPGFTVPGIGRAGRDGNASASASTATATNPHLERIRALALQADGDGDGDGRARAGETPPGHVHFAHYAFLELRGLTTGSLDTADIAFLAAKGCLSVPANSVLDEFVRAYFLQVHPSSPVIDEGGFWRTYKEGHDGKKISLFVFQAVAFAGCPYVAIETIRRCGWKDRRTARNALYLRAKTLYDLLAEDRPHCLAQGAVILTLHTSASEPQISSLWLTRAIQNAMIIGNAESEVAVVDLDRKEKMKKRLWWAIILRDRSVCLGLRRRPQVTSFDMAMGIVTELPDEEDFADEIANSPVYSPDIKRMMLKVLQEQCRLAVLLSEMITFVFASHGIAAPSLSLEQFQEELVKIARTKSAMERWENCSSLKQWMDAGKEKGEKVPEAVLLFVNFTYMYYQTAHINLAHYETLLLENHPLFCGKDYLPYLLAAGKTLRIAMAKLTSIMEYFGREGRAQNLPLSVLAYVAMPLVLTAIDLKLSPTSAEMARRRKRLDALGEIVRHSGRVYDVTDFVTAGTNHILRLAYMTSQHLFLRWDDVEQHTRITERRGSASSSSASSSTPSSISSPDQLSGDVSSAVAPEPINDHALAPGGRADSWHEAFLRFPRAYLLISTSVDYSLAVGRLPYDNALPELVRCIPPIGLGIRLPWTVETPSLSPVMEMDIPVDRARSSRGNLPYIDGRSIAPAEQNKDQDPDHDLLTLSNISLPPIPTNSAIPQQPAASNSQPPLPPPPPPPPDEINLDYLYIAPDTTDQLQLQRMDTTPDFDRLDLQQFAQGFDPLIESWVQEYFGEGDGPQLESPPLDVGMEIDGLI
ncbi:fungal specific transcription factor domain-containing protein [Aspergillus mulundensis]|uniref:Xylanolytic transcriptional activator regulatory domain-containing protein n=1 Tax=Aspergillus mulundensis TaxID=1810919 RepID=A0A3D8QIT9_9EURO|nr:Uncharacterized protein DSM5745_10408 [Aspergillus mulundensis]RDW61736.1 Uncharacterized protein DSM5745_10408 [Aspergillus mulundensis]